MTQNSFIRLVREYAAASRRKGVTYYGAIDALVNSRLMRLKAESPTRDGIDGAEEELWDIVSREYPFERDRNEAARSNKT